MVPGIRPVIRVLTALDFTACPAEWLALPRPYAVVSPYWNTYPVWVPLGLTAPCSTAEPVVMAVARRVATVGEDAAAAMPVIAAATPKTATSSLRLRFIACSSSSVHLAQHHCGVLSCAREGPPAEPLAFPDRRFSMSLGGTMQTRIGRGSRVPGWSAIGWPRAGRTRNCSGIALTVEDDAVKARRRVKSDTDLAGTRRAQRAAEAAMATAAAMFGDAGVAGQRPELGGGPARPASPRGDAQHSYQTRVG